MPVKPFKYIEIKNLKNFEFWKTACTIFIVKYTIKWGCQGLF